MDIRPRDASEILGLPADADRERIEEAWREAVRRTHPDRFPRDPDAVARVAALNAARDVLVRPLGAQDRPLRWSDAANTPFERTGSSMDPIVAMPMHRSARIHGLSPCREELPWARHVRLLAA